MEIAGYPSPEISLRAVVPNREERRLRAAQATRLRKAEVMDPADHQEAHSPTEAVEVRFDAARRTTIEVCRRRIVDARLWDAMGPDRQGAAERIYRGFTAIVGPVAVRIAALERVDGSRSGGLEAKCGLVTDYRRWSKRARFEGIRVSEALDILVGGKSCGWADRRGRRRNGTARANLFAGLDVFCRLKGWREG